MLGSFSLPPARVVLLGFAFHLCSTLFAQDKLLPVFHFQSINGIGPIRSRVVQDEKGFIWIGTLFGLERYDGYSVREYRNKLDDPYSLSSNVITALLVDKKQRLWVGTYDTGLSLYDRATDRFFNLPQRSGDTTWYHAKDIARVLEDRYGNLWLASRSGGVVHVEIPAEKGSDDLASLRSRIHFTTYALGTPRNSATDLLEREDGRIIVASDSGLIILDPMSRNLLRPHFAGRLGRRLDSIAVNCLYRDSRGGIWIGTGTEGVFRLDRLGTTVLNYRHRKGDNLTIRSDAVQDIVEDWRGNMWIASDAGIDLFSTATERCTPYLTVGLTPSWPTWGTALSVDRTGTLWVGTSGGGVHWLSLKSQLFRLYGLLSPNTTRPRVFETIERDSKGKLWFTSAEMIFQIDITSLKVLKVIDVFHRKKPTYIDLSSFIDKRGTFWYGTWGLGLFRVDLASGRVRNYGTESGLGVSCIANGIAQGSGDSLWIAAHDDGLKRFDPVTGRFTGIPGFPRCEVWNVMRDRRGILWITSATNGVYLLDPASGVTDWLRHNPFDLYSVGSDHGRNVYEDPFGRIWIGTGTIVNLWNPETRSFTRYTNPAYSRALFAQPLGLDKKGRLWVDFLAGGLSVLDSSSGVFRNFDVSDGLAGNLNETVTLEDGRMLLSSSEGLHIFNPDSIVSYRAPQPPLMITRMSINDESVVPPFQVKGSRTIRLPYSQNVLEFEFAAIDPGATHLIDYFYRLEGLEDSWVHPSDRRFVRYPGLSPGNYVFRVKAVNKFGRWSDQEISLAVSIAPPWWQRWWFRLIAGGAVIGMLGFIYRREVTRLRKDKLMQQEFSRRQIESQEAERKRLAAELHDGLGQDLLVVSNELQQFLQEGNGSKEDLRQAAALVQESIQSVREISSNLHPHHLDRLGFCSAVEAMTESLARSTGLIIHRSCDDIDRLLPKETEIHVYRIIQEALSNVVRHASAKNVSVRVKKNSESIEITVTDDGKGFNVNSALERRHSHPSGEGLHGFGLSSMTERVRIVGGTMKIESTPGLGTKVQVSLPVPEGRH